MDDLISMGIFIELQEVKGNFKRDHIENQLSVAFNQYLHLYNLHILISSVHNI